MSYVFSTIVFIAVIIYLASKNEKEVPAVGFKIYEKVYPFYSFGIASLFFVYVIFFYLATVRILKRKLLHLRDHRTKFINCGPFKRI